MSVRGRAQVSRGGPARAVAHASAPPWTCPGCSTCASVLQWQPSVTSTGSQKPRAPCPSRTRLPSSSSSPTWPASSASRGHALRRAGAARRGPHAQGDSPAPSCRDEVRHVPGRADAGRTSTRRPPLPPLPAEPRPAALHARVSSTPSLYLSDDVANVKITVGELILDIALLRSINDHVPTTAMSDQAMRLVNRDESRHIAIDYSHGRVTTRRPPTPRSSRPRSEAANEGTHARRSARSRRMLYLRLSPSFARSSSGRWSSSTPPGIACSRPSRRVHDPLGQTRRLRPALRPASAPRCKNIYRNSRRLKALVGGCGDPHVGHGAAASWRP